MKREIKFRGRRIDNLEWVYGYFVKDPEGGCRIYWKPFEEATSNTYHFVLPETVGQYTGRKDIYEGDIIKHGESIRIIESRTSNFHAIRTDKTATILLSFCEKPEIIGNIHENPELLR